jgi:hypothetical protein
MRKTMMTTSGTNRFRALVLFLAALAASLLLAPGVAHAYEVHVSISGAGSVTETTSANLLGSGCWSSQFTPTGSVARDCYAGDPDGPYGWGWVVRYEAHPAMGYTFWKWDSDGGTDAVICDGAFDAKHTGSTCQFATFGNLQTRAFFVDDYPPVEVNITSGPSQPVSGPATFVYHLAVEWYGEPADPTFKQFECRVAREDRSILYDWQPCGTNQGYGSITMDPPEDGLYRFDVRGVDYSGNVSLRKFQSYYWTVDKAPTVASNDVTPTQGQTGVQRNTDVSATFSEPMSANSLTDPSTQTSNTFKIQQWNKKRKSWKTLPATVSLSSDGKTATLDPYGDTATLLVPNKKYRVTIASRTTDMTGNPLSQNFVWTFTTGAT